MTVPCRGQLAEHWFDLKCSFLDVYGRYKHTTTRDGKGMGRGHHFSSLAPHTTACHPALCNDVAVAHTCAVLVADSNTQDYYTGFCDSSGGFAASVWRAGCGTTLPSRPRAPVSSSYRLPAPPAPDSGSASPLPASALAASSSSTSGCRRRQSCGWDGSVVMSARRAVES